MKTRKIILYFFIVALFFTSCKKDKDCNGEDYTLLSGSYGAICSNSRDEILVFGNGGDGIDSTLIIVKTDQEGNILWEKKYEVPFGIIPRKVISTDKDEHILLAFLLIQYSPNSYHSGAMWVKINDEGDTLFTRRVHQEYTDKYPYIMQNSNNGFTLILSSSHHNRTEIIELTEFLEIISEVTIDETSYDYLVADYPNGNRYIMCDRNWRKDSLLVKVFQESHAGEFDSIHYLVRDNPFGKAFFSSDENEIFWIYPEGNSVGIVKTNLNNQVLSEEHYKVTNWLISNIEYIAQIDGITYAIGHYREDINSNFKYYLLKISTEGEIIKLYPDIIIDYVPIFYCFTALRNGNFAAINQVEGGYGLRIYQ